MWHVVFRVRMESVLNIHDMLFFLICQFPFWGGRICWDFLEDNLLRILARCFQNDELEKGEVMAFFVGIFYSLILMRKWKVLRIWPVIKKNLLKYGWLEKAYNSWLIIICHLKFFFFLLQNAIWMYSFNMMLLILAINCFAF